jgi:glycogen synthase
MRRILLAAYESRFAPCGGIAAVLNYLPGHLRSAAGISTSVITPLHHRIPATSSLPVRIAGKVKIPYKGMDIEVDIYRYDDRWSWYFLDAQGYEISRDDQLAENDDRFFGGRRHPYDVGTDAGSQWAILRRDSLLFGVALARALPVIGTGVSWTLVLQDWETAATALALAGPDRNDNVKLYLTLHNSYDSGEIHPVADNAEGRHPSSRPLPGRQPDLQDFGIDPDHVPAPEIYSKTEDKIVAVSTILGRAIPLINKPFFTVSEQFAKDLTEDVFQSDVMADHLQDLLKTPNLVGINNGPFTSLAVPEEPQLAEARRHKYASLKDWKSTQKAAAITALAEFKPTDERPAWGRITSFVEEAQARADLPWFVLAGRDDTRQKGYDVAAEAIRKFLTKPGSASRAQFLFFPIPGDESRDGLAFLQKLANDFEKSVLVLPFIFREGYLTALQGAAFGIMPSLYEPFGMANEFYLNGAVGIGRATGGLLQQVIPLRTASCFTPEVGRLPGRWHPPSTKATGFLYREPEEREAVKHWKAFNEATYLSTPSKDRLAERRKYGLFTNMADALEQALNDAIDIYAEPPASNGVQRYYTMLVEGIAHIERGFSWDLAASEYNGHFL